MFSAAITTWVGLVDIRSAFSCLYCSCSSVKVNTSQVKQNTVYSEMYKFIFILSVFTCAIFKLYCSYTVLRNPTAVRHRCAQRCDSNSADTVMLQCWQWQRWDSGDNWLCCVSWHCCDSDVYISVTAMTADSAVTAMCTLVWQHCQLSLHCTLTVMCTSLSH